MVRTFKIILEKESTGFSVIVPSLSGCTSQGETIQECMANAKEAIQLYIETLKEDHMPLPEMDPKPSSLARCELFLKGVKFPSKSSGLLFNLEIVSLAADVREDIPPAKRDSTCPF